MLQAFQLEATAAPPAFDYGGVLGDGGSGIGMAIA